MNQATGTSSPSFSSHSAPTTRRGGAGGSPLHIFQIVLTGALLLASSVLLILHNWLPGFLLLAIGTVLAMINPYRS